MKVECGELAVGPCAVTGSSSYLQLAIIITKALFVTIIQ